MKKLRFIWGPGGVGKSHVAIREAARAPGEKKLLLTLDPSYRLFSLLGMKASSSLQKSPLGFDVKATKADELFNRLHAKLPASPNVREFFTQLVEGLQRFQDYLALIELAEEIEEAHYDIIIVDTPPFAEAVGLHHSIESLSDFFQNSIIQLAQRSGWLNVAVKKLLDVAKIFAGKKAVENSLEFIDWLHLHIDRFQAASQQLQKMIYAETTSHLFVLNPESSPRVLHETKDFFQKASQFEFFLNKSVASLPLASLPEALKKEFSHKSKREEFWVKAIQGEFPKAQLRRLPLQVMGTDAQKELQDFIETNEITPDSRG